MPPGALYLAPITGIATRAWSSSNILIAPSARDPRYAEAYAGLADCYNLLREYTTMPPQEAYPLAKAAEAYERMMSGKARFRVVLTME